jgi:hypothetical protein
VQAWLRAVLGLTHWVTGGEAVEREPGLPEPASR